MTRKSVTLLLAAALLTISAITNATTRRVLFIGNSYTYTNNMPGILDSIAKAMGDTLIWDMSATGGYTFEMQTTFPTTISKIFSNQWDVVVLQEQSELPSFPPDQVDTQVYPYATRLDSMIHANDTCTQTMFLMTWGHANGDPLNCPGYPTICTYDGMQERLRESYLQMGITNHACVAPVGSAFKIMMDSAYTPWLYMSDSDHPVVPGSYLAASVLYASIFHKTDLNCAYTAGIPSASAANLQRIATKVVFDSFAQWQQNGHYPYAGFTHSTSGATATFTSISPVPTQYSWSFGDGSTSTAANPTHTYTATGTYTVTNTVHTNCFSETLTDTVQVTVHNTAVAATGNVINHISVLQEGAGQVVIVLPATGTELLELYNTNGSIVKRYTSPANRLEEKLTPGFYFYKWYSQGGGEFETGKIVVY